MTVFRFVKRTFDEVVQCGQTPSRYEPGIL